MSEGPKQGLGGVFKAEALSIGLGRSIEKKNGTRVEALVGRFEDDPLIWMNLWETERNRTLG